METNFQMIKKLNKFRPEMRGILTADEAEHIKETLHLNEFTDVLSLRNLRDFVVLYFHNQKDYSKEDISRMDLISAITHLIDVRIWELGGEV